MDRDADAIAVTPERLDDLNGYQQDFQAMNLSKPLLALLVACVAVTWPSKTSAITRTVPLSSVCDEADWVFVGTVTSRSAEWAPGATGHIITTVTMVVERTAKGSPPTYINFPVVGGEKGGLVEYIPEMPRLPVDSVYLMVMTKQPSKPPRLIGAREGAIPLESVPSQQAVDDYWETYCGSL